MVRALPCHGRGYGFEPRHSRQSLPVIACLAPRGSAGQRPSSIRPDADANGGRETCSNPDLKMGGWQNMLISF